MDREDPHAPHTSKDKNSRPGLRRNKDHCAQCTCRPQHNSATGWPHWWQPTSPMLWTHLLHALAFAMTPRFWPLFLPHKSWHQGQMDTSSRGAHEKGSTAGRKTFPASLLASLWHATAACCKVLSCAKAVPPLGNQHKSRPSAALPHTFLLTPSPPRTAR